MAKKKKKVVKKQPEEKFLNESQVSTIEKHSKWLEIKKLELRIAELDHDNKRLQAQIDLKELSTKFTMIKKSIDDKILEHKGYMVDVAKEFNIAGKWSFDPISGEIMED